MPINSMFRQLSSINDSKDIYNHTSCQQLYDLPPQLIMKSFDYFDKTICVIQDPYSRILFEYLRGNNSNLLTNHGYCSQETMNYMINTWIRNIINETNKLFTNNHHCLYIYHNHNIPNIHKMCDHIIYYDSNYSPNQLCNKYDLSVENFSDETIYHINILYEKSFELFNFTKKHFKTNRKRPDNQIWIENAGKEYRKYYSNLYQMNYSVLENHKNKCKILPIEAEQSKHHKNKQKTLPYRIIPGQQRRRIQTKPFNSSHNNYNFTIALCVRLKNELRYLFEWIEYHHFIQNIDYIWIFDHHSRDRVDHLTNIYGDKWLNVIDIGSETDGYKQCKLKADKMNVSYVGIWDVDEFMYATNYDTIKEYIYNVVIPNNYLWTRIQLIGYGTYTDDEPFKYDIDNRNISSIKPINGNDGIKTVIGSYLYRGPHRAVDADIHTLEQQWNNTDCTKYKFHGDPTSEYSTCLEGATMKSITKISECAELDTHHCKTWNSNIKQPVDQHWDGILGNHYLFRFHQNFFQSYAWPKYDKWVMLMSNINEKQFNAVYDPSLATRYHKRVSQRLYNLLQCDSIMIQL